MNEKYRLVSGGNIGAAKEIEELGKRNFGLSIDILPARGDVLRIKQGDYECSVMIVNIVHDIIDGEHTKTRLVIESVDTTIN